MTGSADDGDDRLPGSTGQEPAEEEWAVTLEDLEPDEAPAPIEAGSPSPEHVAFVLLGVILTLGVIYRLVILVGAIVP